MTNKKGTLKIDFDFFIAESEKMVDSDQGCQEVLEKHRKLFDSLKDKGLTVEAMEVDNVVSAIETAVREAVYRKAFEAGMRFILNTMSGKEVIEII